MTKKIGKSALIFALMLVILTITAFFSMQNTAYAETNEEDYGYEIDGYKVQILYHNYTKYITGVYYAYEVVFDKDFYFAVSDKKALMSSVKETFVKNNFEVETDVKNGKMTAYLSYDSITDYYIEQGIDGYAVSQGNKPSKSTLFYTEYVSTTQTVFVGLKTEGRFVNRIYNACVNAGIGDEDILLSYVYGTPYNEKTISSTADEVDYQANEAVYYHTFNMKVSEKDEYITFTQRVPNSTGWYVVAIILGIAVLSVPLTVMIINNKRRKQNGGN